WPRLFASVAYQADIHSFPSSSGEVRHHVLAEEMAYASKPVGRPLDGAREFKDTDATVCVTFAQHKPGDPALSVVSCVCDVDQATRGFEWVVYVGTSALGHLGCGVDT